MYIVYYLHIKLRGLGNMRDREITILHRMVRQGLFDKVKFEHRPEGREGKSHMDK